MQATDASIQKKIFGSRMHPSDSAKGTTLIISNEEVKYIMKIVKSFEESGKATENEANEQKDGFLDMLVGLLAATLFTNM